MLAADFAASRQPAGLRKLILANCPSSMKLTSEGINVHMQDFPPVMIEMFQKHEANGTIESPEYKEEKGFLIKNISAYLTHGLRNL